MARKFQNAVQNFAAGVLSPRLSADIESEAFNRALRTAKNFIITPQGGAIFREGYQYISDALRNDPFRVFTFKRGGDISDILVEVSAGHIRYWLDVDGTPELVVDRLTLLTDETTSDFLIDETTGEPLTVGTIISPNSYSVADLDTLYFTNQGSYGVICHENHPFLIMTVFGDGNIITDSIAKERIPQFAYPDFNAPNASSNAAQWRITFPEQWLSYPLMYSVSYRGVVGKDDDISIYRPFDPDTPATNVTNVTEMLDEAAAAQGLSTTFVVTSISDLVYDIVVSGDDAGWDVKAFRIGPWFWGSLAYPGDPVVQNRNESTDDPLEEPAWSYPTMVTHNGRYYRCKQTHRSVLIINEPGNTDPTSIWDEFWEDLGIAEPVGWAYQYPSGNAWVADKVYWPKDRGFPTVCVFHEQRLIVMANKDNPTALYGSALGSYFDFIPGPNDDQAFLYVLDSSDTPEIKWAKSQRSLILGTSGGEWSINAEVTITPSDINAEQQNAARSRLAIPAHVDTEVFYVEQGGRKLRLTAYSDDLSNTFTSSNISLLAEHLISTEGINRVASSQIPETLLTINRNDGQVVFAAVEKARSVLAFSEGETDGEVFDSTSYFSLFENIEYTFNAVERNGRWVLERMKYPTGKEVTELYAKGIAFLDGWVTGTVDGTEISGLDHLEGKTVWVLVNDAWQIGTFVVSQGSVTLPEDEDGKTFVAGLPYIGELETFELNDNFRAIGLGARRRWNKLWTRILNSALPKVFGQRDADRTPPVPMGTAETVREGLQDIPQNVSGYGDGSITVLHDRPYPLQIVAFFGEYQVEDR